MTPDRDTPSRMRQFWDEKARENAMYYVSSYLPYGREDPAEFWKWGGILADRFLDESGVPLHGDETMLEIGCGIGRMTARFSERFGRVHGLDVSAEMVEQARENLAGRDNVTLHVGNGVDLSDFDDDAFDFVFSYIVFQHIPDPRVVAAYIREAGRVLRPGGHFYFQVNNLPTGLRERLRLGRVRRAARRLIGARGRTPAPAGAGEGDEGPRGLDHPAWVGSRMGAKQIEKSVTGGKMRIQSVRGEGTQYMWVLATKP